MTDVAITEASTEAVTTETKAKKKQMPKRFDKAWKDTPFRNRGIKMFFHPTPEQAKQLEQLRVTKKEATNACSRRILDLLESKYISEDEVKKNQNTELADRLYKTDPVIKAIIEKCDFGLARQKRGAVLYALRLHNGYATRNKKKTKTAPRIRKNTVMHFIDGELTDKPDKHRPGHGVMSIAIDATDEKGKPVKIDVAYTVPRRMWEKKAILDKMANKGGNIICKKGKFHYVPMVTVPFQWRYQPEQALGFDLNKTEAYFIALSRIITVDGKERQKLPHSKKMRGLMKKLSKLNEEIKKDGLKSSQRRAIRRKVKKAHNRFEVLCAVYCEGLLKAVVENQFLLCIDPLSCGAQTGTFGHEKVVNYLTKKCEDNRIPFVHVPTPHTSKCCNQCGLEVDRTDQDKAICDNCGPLNAQYNGAYNTADWGWRIWQEGTWEWSKWKAKWFKRNPRLAKKTKSKKVVSSDSLPSLSEDNLNIGS